jgi:hypothetical protein
MPRARVFWGLMFLLGGGLLLLDNLGLLPTSAGRLFWPVLVILAGVWILLRGWLGAGDTMVRSRREPLNGATMAAFTLKHGAGRLVVSGASQQDELFAGDFAGGIDARVRRSGDRADVQLAVPSSGWMNLPWTGGTGFQWDLRLSDQVQLTLGLETGAGETVLNLSELQVRDLKIQTGASSTEVALPQSAGETRVKVEAGAASVKLSVPPRVAARIHSSSGLVDLDIDQTRFPRGGSTYESADYEAAENRVEIDIEAGVGAIQIR